MARIAVFIDRDGTFNIEKGITGLGLIDAGCYVLPTDILNDYPLGKPFSLEADFLANSCANHGLIYL